MTAREVISRLKAEGWTARSGKGSHLIFRKDGRQTVVSNHRGGDLATGTLHAICKQTGWEFPPKRKGDR